MHYLTKSPRYPSIVYNFYGFHWCKSNHEFQMRTLSPMVANAYPLSGDNPIKKEKKNDALTLTKNGLTGSATQQIFIIQYRYRIK